MLGVEKLKTCIDTGLAGFFDNPFNKPTAKKSSAAKKRQS
jgi:hypothetical protein